jgi:AbiV family abortive infection protein
MSEAPAYLLIPVTGHPTMDCGTIGSYADLAGSPMTPFKPEVLQAIEACRNHAQDLYNGAILLREKDLPNLAYHLATLALEELGKAQLIGMHSFAKEDADSWYTKQISDHIKKLFWALWGDAFGKRPDKKYLEELRGTATVIHENRLAAIYVEPNPERFVAPKDLVTDEMLAPLMNFVAIKLKLNPSIEGVEYEQEHLDLINWFSNATDDPEKRKFIFSPASFEKMTQLDAKEWLLWVRDEIQQADTLVNETLQREMKRGFTPGEAGLEYKWEVKLRLFSQVHSIRPKPLNHWNNKVEWIKLFPVDGKKNYLDVLLKVPKFIPIQGVYYVAYCYSNLLVAALNISSGGLFWWQEPKNLSAFYESLVDNENNMGGVIGRSPELKIAWRPGILEEAMLDQALGAFAMMPQPQDPPEQSEALSNYMAAIGFIAKTDVFLQFELQAYGAFLAAAKAIFRLYRDDMGDKFPTDIASLQNIIRSQYDRATSPSAK